MDGYLTDRIRRGPIAWWLDWRERRRVCRTLARRAEVDRQIVEGYTRQPQTADEIAFTLTGRAAQVESAARAVLIAAYKHLIIQVPEQSELLDALVELARLVDARWPTRIDSFTVAHHRDAEREEPIDFSVGERIAAQPEVPEDEYPPGSGPYGF